jgi:hypothetical protein
MFLSPCASSTSFLSCWTFLYGKEIIPASKSEVSQQNVKQTERRKEKKGSKLSKCMHKGKEANEMWGILENPPLPLAYLIDSAHSVVAPSLLLRELEIVEPQVLWSELYIQNVVLATHIVEGHLSAVLER